jgi:chemotaxis protein histidine kinase CheA
MPTEEQVNRLQVHWKRSRDHFQSFLSGLAEVRQEINDDNKFASWCIWELKIGVSIISDVAAILRKADADVAKAELKSTKDAEKAEQKAKREAETAQREAERQERLARKAAQEEAAKKAVRQKQSRASYQRQKEKQMAAYAAKVSVAPPPPPPSPPTTVVVKISNNELGVKIVSMYDRLVRTRAEWITYSVELAGLLTEARARFPNDKEFGDWLAEIEINLSHQDRAALISLGANPAAMQKALENTSSFSYRLIWADVKRQLAVTHDEAK